MFSSGSREGEDLRRAWNSLQEEERQAAHWLEVGMQDNLSGGVEEVGGVSCDGSTGGNCQRSETSPELELSKRDLRCILARIEQTDQFRLGSKVTSCQLLGCKLYLVQTQASQVASSQEQQPPSFVFHLQPAVTDLARWSEERRWSTSLASPSCAQSQLATTTGKAWFLQDATSPDVPMGWSRCWSGSLQLVCWIDPTGGAA